MAIPIYQRLRALGELARFYQAAIVNTAFGFGTYALLIWLGVNLYAAQLIAQVLGVTFNYFTYSRHVFRGTDAAKGRFVVAYVANYFVNLGFLALFDLFVHSPYISGLAATFFASLVNYFALKHMVFSRQVAP